MSDTLPDTSTLVTKSLPRGSTINFGKNSIDFQSRLPDAEQRLTDKVKGVAEHLEGPPKLVHG